MFITQTSLTEVGFNSSTRINIPYFYVCVRVYQFPSRCFLSVIKVLF